MMGKSLRAVRLLTLSCLFATCLLPEGIYGASTLRIVRRGRRTGIPAYGSEESANVIPELPAPKALEEQQTSSSSQNEVSAELGTTTELSSSEEQQPQGLEDVGVSEDYVFTTATQMSPGHDDTTGSSVSLEDPIEEKIEQSESHRRNSEVPLGGGGYAASFQAKTMDEAKTQVDLYRMNEVGTSSNNKEVSGGYFTARIVAAPDQQQVENQEHQVQVQTQAPSPAQEPKASYEQIAAIHQPSIYQAQPERKDFPNARQYEQQQGSGGYGGRQQEIPQGRRVQQQQEPLDQQPQPQQLYQSPQQFYQQPQGLYQQPQSQPQQFYQRPQPQQQQQMMVEQLPQPQQLYQQPQQTEQPPVQQQIYQQPQQGYQQPQVQRFYQQPQQFYQQPQQQQQATTLATPVQLYQQPQQTTPQSVYQTTPQSQYGPPQQQQQQTTQQSVYQTTPQSQYGPPQQQYPLAPEPVSYSRQQQYQQQNEQPQERVGQEQLQGRSVQAEPRQSSYRPQQYRQPEPQVQYGQPQLQSQGYAQGGQQQRALYNPPSSGTDRSVLDNNVENSGNVVNNIEVDGNDDPSTLEGLDNNIVDAELLERVQQIIEEHERQQKEVQQRLRQAQRENNDNEFQQPNIYTESNESSSPQPENPGSSERQGEGGGYSRQQPPSAYSPIRNDQEAVSQPPQQPEPSYTQSPPQLSQMSRNIPESYFRQDSQGGYSNSQNNEREGNRGRALMDNKKIDFQPAILTSHFVESSGRQRNGGSPQGNQPGYLPPTQQSQQPQQPAPPQNYQTAQYSGQNNFVQSQQPQQVVYQQMAQPQQPEAYYIPQQQQQQKQPQSQAVDSNAGGYSYPQPLPVPARLEATPAPPPEPETNQENSLEYFQRQGGYSQPQNVYLLPMPAAQYQQPQQYQGGYQQDTNVIQSEPETPNIITRTIVIHEQPTSVYGPDNNRAIVTAEDLRGGAEVSPPYYPSNNQQVYQQQPQPVQQPQPQELPQQYQYLTATAQYSLAPEPALNSAPQYQYTMANNGGGKDIVAPRPVYGIPLAPALGPNDIIESSVQSNHQTYLPPQQGNSIQESSSDQSTVRAPSYRNIDGVSADYSRAVPLVSNTVSLPTREYTPNSDTVEQTTPSRVLPYGRRIDRQIRKRFSTAVTSPLAGFFSVKANKST